MSKKSGIQYQDEIPVTLKGSLFYGLNLDEEQIKFRDAIWDNTKKIIFCNAKSGTGKTTISLGVANLLVHYGLYDGIIYVVSPTMEEKQGYIPGSVEEKSEPYVQPLYEALVTLGLNPFTSVASNDNLKSQKDGTAFIYFTPHTFLRGCNFDKKVVILDESQNFYRSEIQKTLTRIKDTCKVIVIGHTGQCDLFKNPKNSGFKVAMDLYKSKNDERVAICGLSVNHRGWISTVADELESEIRGY